LCQDVIAYFLLFFINYFRHLGGDRGETLREKEEEEEGEGDTDEEVGRKRKEGERGEK
jgi:hypothetical protein